MAGKFKAPRDFTVPPTPTVDGLPRYLTAPEGARVANKWFDPCSARSLRDGWNLPWIMLKGRCCVATADLIAEGERRIAAAKLQAMAKARVMEAA